MSGNLTPELIKHNKNLVWHALLFYLDSGLAYLKREYVSSSQNPIQTLTSEQIYDFIVKENIRKNIKVDLRLILDTALEFVNFEQENNIAEYYFDDLVDRKYPHYKKYDMILIHARKNHNAYGELKMISKFIFRISVYHTIQLIKYPEDVKTYNDLVFGTYKNYKQAKSAMNSILTMFDRMVDVFESNLDIISIPFYRPTFTLRDFKFIRKVYEYALKILDEDIRRIFNLEPCDDCW